MEEIGDWIYILVIIIAGVASLISSARKKARKVAEQTQSPRQVVIEQGESNDIWDDFIPQSEKKPEIIVQAKREAIQPKVSVKNYHTPFLYIQQEEQSDVQATESQLLDVNDEYAVITVDDLPNEPGEWRKAFIYNEIFSRRN